MIRRGQKGERKGRREIMKGKEIFKKRKGKKRERREREEEKDEK